jgi:hypothetical protein
MQPDHSRTRRYILVRVRNVLRHENVLISTTSSSKSTDIPWGTKRRSGSELNHHLHLVTQLRMSGALPLLPIYTFNALIG